MTTDWFGTPMTPLAGGYGGETFLVGGDGADEVVLRIYRRDPARAVIDASLLRLARGILPVAEVIEARPAHAGQPGILVTERLPGERLDLILPAATAEQRVEVGRNLGRLLATLSGIPMLRFGMFEGADLELSAEAPRPDLLSWARHYRDTSRLGGWSEPDWRRLLALVAEAEERLAGDHPAGRETDPGFGRFVLAHSDFNPKNLLVDPDKCTITGLLDWEFAHAGSPYTDLGNLTRFERHPDFVDAVVSTFVTHAPRLGGDPLRLGRSVDLWALIELAGRERLNAVGELAQDLLLAQARAGDLGAWPWDEPRRDPTATGL